MKLLTYADRTVLIGDDAADTLLEFSAMLAETGHADSVVLNAIDSDGSDVVASFLLGSGTNLMAQSTSSTLPEPANDEGIAYMRGKLADLETPPSPQTNDTEVLPSTDELDGLPGLS